MCQFVVTMTFAFLGKKVEESKHDRSKQKCKQKCLESPPHSFTGVFATEAG